MPIDGVIKPNTYRDSVALMSLTTRLAELSGVAQASAMMGTPANKDILDGAGLLAPSLREAGPNDLCLVIDAPESVLPGAFTEADRLLVDGADAPRGVPVAGERRPRTIDAALRSRPDANLALISVPGEYAASEAWRALRRDLHVFLFSDNVPLDEEVALKTMAAERGLLLMGPDCGTALVAGAPLGFANAVRRGSIGLVGSSGTGLQDVSSAIHRQGEGVSHALGTGSRDLSAEVGGKTFLAALDALAADPDTRVLVLIAKPGAPEVRRRIYERLDGIDKPAVVYFLGAAEHDAPADRRFVVAADLDHATRCAIALSRGETPPEHGVRFGLKAIDAVERELTRLDRPPEVVPLGESTEQLVLRIFSDLGPTQRTISGLFAGGTLAQEAADTIRRALGVVDDAKGSEPGELLSLRGHRILDLGDDAYTRGRPHPLIDPRLRNEQLIARAARGDVALFLIDVILGYGAHPDPAAALRPALERAGEAAAAAGTRLHVLASVIGTDQDPQGYVEQRAALKQAGVLVADSSSIAAVAAAGLAYLLDRED